ncbi:NAD-dependent epimerase/dehydratase family protein [Aliivibrio fischeri]|uniref:NAD-dependent epimerase/dehydratase family protein n=1 Tax=Aliivibrio fischeri TaxID=668 RepID=UPI00080DA5DE|nr:NAD(P)-dependent oxidoreductase [Aliivibrio fischeri]OCH37512.1 dTDP-glucose 4,6-dehydratase [Aliivibrio fischeri]
MKIELDDLKLIMLELEPYIGLLRNKSIFITGGTGFFGKWLLEAINYLNRHLDLMIKVTVLSRNAEIFKFNFPHLSIDSNITFISGDIRSFSTTIGCYNYIIHAATEASSALNKENPSLMRSTIMDGAKHICNFANTVKCERLLYTSSGAAYGPQPSNMKAMSEDFIINPNFNFNDAYSSAKLESEDFFKNNLKCQIIVARCFAFSGPYLPLDGNYAFGNFIRDALDGRNISLNGDGTAIRSYLYAADLVIWLIKALVIGQDRAIYNIGSPDPITTLKLAEKICDASGNNSSVNVLNKSSDSGNIYIPCTLKSQTDLGVDVYTSIEDSILKTLKFYR